MIEASLTNAFLVMGASLCPLSLIVGLLGFLWAIGMAIRESVAQLKRLHSIPCDQCVYFTGCHYLKCAVHPSRALTEDAADCLDFEPALYSKTCCSSRCKP
jgi:hypothetical protein